MYDTTIIGAGPVGSYLAIKLALLGHKVIVLEKNPVAGHSICCTGIISRECYDLLSLDGNIVTRRANSAKFFTPSGRCIRLWRNDEVAYITDRAALDYELASKAQKIGVTYHFSTQVPDIKLSTNRLLVKANSHEGEKSFETETAIITTGYGSDLPGNLGLGKIKDFNIGAQTKVNTNSADEVEIYFDQKLSPGGFAWLVPTGDGKGLAGLITRQQPEQHLAKLISRLQTQGKISTVVPPSRYAAIPLRPLSKTYTDRILVVGEAAGQVKPTTSGGIYYGIICADIAANVLYQAFNAGDLSATRLSAYQKQWQAKLGRELIIDYWTQRLWAKLPNSLIEHLFNIAQQRHIPELVTNSKNFSFDWHSQLLLQIVRSLLPQHSKKQEFQL